MDLERVRRALALTREKRALEARLREVAAELDPLRKEVLPEAFIASGLASLQIDGATFYIHRQGWAKKADESVTGEAIIAALQAAGLGTLATANWQALSGHLRELAERGDVLPRELEGVIAFAEEVDVRCRNPGSGAVPADATTINES